MISPGKRWKYAFRVFFSLIFHGRIAPDILADFASPPPAAAAPPPPPETSDRAAQMLALLQRDGRLVDFLMEDVSAYADAQIGAAVRDVHLGCRQVLTKYATLAAVLDDEEGSQVTIDRVDPARVKIVGSVAGSPPLRGVLRHRGWELRTLDLPPLPATGRTILAPAEVEVA